MNFLLKFNNVTKLTNETDRIHMRYAIQPAFGEIDINWVDFENVPKQEA